LTGNAKTYPSGAQVGTNRTWGSVFEWGDVDDTYEQADVVVEIDRLKLGPPPRSARVAILDAG
jgi:hypothetical protein